MSPLRLTNHTPSSYKVPGQFVGIRLDGGTKEREGGTGKVAGNLVAVSTEPTSVRQDGGKVQVLVSGDDTFRLKGEGFILLFVHFFVFVAL